VDANGKGSGSGLGLLGMNERVGALGGTLAIAAGTEGMRVIAVLPLPGNI